MTALFDTSESFWREAPHITCPQCDAENFAHNYFEMGIGAEWQCTKCDTTIECCDEEAIKRWCWKVQP